MQSIALVLGAAVLRGGVPSSAVQRRAGHAAALWHAGAVGRFVLCGGVVRHPPSEAEALRALLVAAGVPEAVLVIEDRSTDTIGNFQQALALCPELRHGAVVVSDRSHRFRVRLIASHLGVPVRMECPAPPQMRLRERLGIALREALSFLKVFWWMASGRRLPSLGR